MIHRCGGDDSMIHRNVDNVKSGKSVLRNVASAASCAAA